MYFWDHFVRVLWRRPVPALAALYWQLTRRRVRARNRLQVASADLPFAYEVWIQKNELPPQSGSGDGARAANCPSYPKFSVVIHTPRESDGQVSLSSKSVERQSYPHWKVATVRSKAIGTAIAEADGDFIVALRAGDQLHETALLRLAQTLQVIPDAGVLYADEDRIDRRGRRRFPWFKPEWNEELFLARDYLASTVVIEARLAKSAAVACCGELPELLLDATHQAKKIVHVPHVLVHAGSDVEPDPGRIEAVARHLAPRGATCLPGPYGTVKVNWPLPNDLPLVSVLIPTKDKLDVLRPCVESLLQQTEYPSFEILIIDNGSTEGATIKFFNEVTQDRRVRVLSYDRPFNYSAINNFAAGHARGAYLCMLNNDTQVVEPGWLTELMRYALRTEIGAAGAKLLYEDGSIQHAGVVVGIGEAAGHAHRFLPFGDPGYFHMAHVSHFVSAVTGACLVVEKKKFEAVGGFDEENLAIAFNDVDLCLKLEAHGWRNVYVPHAVLVHHESRSRASDMSPTQLDRYLRELAVLQERWGTKTYKDPLHNPNLDRYSETYVFRL